MSYEMVAYHFEIMLKGFKVIDTDKLSTLMNRVLVCMFQKGVLAVRHARTKRKRRDFDSEMARVMRDIWVHNATAGVGSLKAGNVNIATVTTMINLKQKYCNLTRIVSQIDKPHAIETLRRCGT
eukprot:scaffold263494_cov15-Tisochrysis_lutea.AAC.1